MTLITVTDQSGDTMDVPLRSVVALCRRSALSSKPSQVLLLGQIFVSVSRAEADRVYTALVAEKE